MNLLQKSRAVPEHRQMRCSGDFGGFVMFIVNTQKFTVDFKRKIPKDYRFLCY